MNLCNKKRALQNIKLYFTYEYYQQTTYQG